MIAQLDTYARAILGALGAGMAVAAGLALLVALLARTSNTSATTRHVLWWIAFSAAALLPLASLAMSFHRIEHHLAQPAHDTRGDTARSAATLGANGTHADHGASAPARDVRASHATDAESAAARATAGNGDVTRTIDWLALASRVARAIAHIPGLPATLVAVWLVIAMVRIAFLVPGLVWLTGVKRAALPLDESIVRRLRRYRHGSRTGRAATISVSADIDVPIAVGFGTPAILLPIRVVETETVADLDQIVMHEHAHLNRYDDVTNLIQCLVERLFWFNPVIAFAGRRISLEREIACDDSVVAQTGRAYRYATCLWKLVESARLPARPVMAPGALLTPKQITLRIEQLLDSKRNALPRLSPVSAIALALLGTCLIVFQAQRAPVIALEDPVAQPVLPAPPVRAAALRVAAPFPPAPSSPAIAIDPAAVAAPPGIVHPVAAPAPAVASQPNLSHLSQLSHLERVEQLHREQLGHLAQLAHVSLPAKLATIAPEANAEGKASAALDRSERELKREIREHTATAASLGMSFGLDIAKQISMSFAPSSQWPDIGRSIERAKNDATREMAMNASADVAYAPEGNHRELGSFHRLEVNGSFNVIVRHGSSTYVDFQNDTEVASHTRTRVEDGSLVIDETNESYSERRPKPILVYTPSLDAVTLNGSADVTVEDASGEHFAIDITGSGDLVASGTVSSAAIHIEGSGDANLIGLTTSSMTISSAGSGDVKINAPQNLAIHIQGSGDVSIRGTPKHLSSDINGSGDIIHI